MLKPILKGFKHFFICCRTFLWSNTLSSLYHSFSILLSSNCRQIVVNCADTKKPTFGRIFICSPFLLLYL